MYSISVVKDGKTLEDYHVCPYERVPQAIVMALSKLVDREISSFTISEWERG